MYSKLIEAYNQPNRLFYHYISSYLLGTLNMTAKVRICTNCLNNIFVEETFSNYQLNAQFFNFSTICMLHYAPQHVSSSTLLILRRTNCITTASGIVTLCKQLYSMQVESRGELSYLAPLGSENISAPYFKQCFF